VDFRRAFDGRAGGPAHSLGVPPGKGGHRASAGRKAALLGIAAATGFGFVAAVVKELSTHLSQGFSGVFLNWSPYVLLLSGAAAMFLASNAFQAGSLAASQPGLTIVDPLVASLLGVILFGERLDHNPVALVGEVVAVVVLVVSVVVLSRSPLVQDEDSPPQDRGGSVPAGVPASSNGKTFEMPPVPRARGRRFNVEQPEQNVKPAPS
jgi:hypothetical protein